jgi:preprotein translocase subunit SecG
MNIVSVLQVIWSLSAVGLVIFVLLHSPKGDGIGGIGGQAQLFTSTKSAETTLNRITWSLAIVFMGLTVILSSPLLTPKG